MPVMFPRFSREDSSKGKAARPKTSSHGLLFRIRVGAYIALAGSLLLGFIFLWLNGWYAKQVEKLPKLLAFVSQKTGFVLDEIIIEGREHTSVEEIYAALGAAKGSPIFAISIPDVLEKIKSAPWVANAAVERRLPNTIYIRIFERRPLARWQKSDNTVVVIDREGKELPGIKAEDFSYLPLLMGEGAPEKAEEFLQELIKYPSIKNITKAIIRVGERRWNLFLEPKVTVRLPEHDTGDALKKLDGFINEKKILDLDIESIDLRFRGRLILEPPKDLPVTEKKAPQP